MSKTFDYIIVGGGSGGCVVAGRLTEDPAISVCVLEAGGRGDGAIVNVPTGAVAMLPTRVNNWAFDTVPQPGLGGRIGYQPRGKSLGGSSAINAMVYIRGHRIDYDGWAALGNEGWAYDNVLPYFRLSEHNERFDDEWHGRDGPLWVSDLRTDNPFHARYREAARQTGLPLTDDFNGAQQEGIGLYQVTQKHGERWSAARAYLLPHVGRRDNLTVETHAQVLRILFEGTRAAGVEVRQHGEVRTLRARREVVLAAGALQTPQLLMLSGVGPARELQQFGIPVRADLPGVGRNLQDHPDFIFGYRTRSADTMGVSVRGGLRMLRELTRFRRERRGMLTSNFAEGGGFLKTRAGLDAPDIQLHFVVALVDDHARRFHLGHGLSCHVCLLRPRSRGSVMLRSADPLDAPRIDPAFFDDRAISTIWWPPSSSRAGSCKRPRLRSGRRAMHLPSTRAPTTRSATCSGNAPTPCITRSARAGWTRRARRGRSSIARTRAGRVAHRRRVRDADADRRQHQRAYDHDRGKASI